MRMSDMMEKGTVNQEVNNDAGASLSAGAADPKTVVVETPNVQATNASQDVIAKLQEYGATPAAIDKIVNEFGVETMDELSSMTADELFSAGMKLVKARTMLNGIQKPATVTGGNTSAQTDNIGQSLPDVPSDSAWLDILRTGGVLKVDESSYIAAVRATQADQMGLYDIPDKLVKAMEAYTDETEEQLDARFFKMRNMLTRRNYSEIFQAIEGLDGSFVTAARRKEFLLRVKETFWPALQSSFQALNAWEQALMANYANPAMFASQMNAMMRGGAAPITFQVDSSGVRDAGASLADAINRVFRGYGTVIAAALAYEAYLIRQTLEDPSLPKLLGTPNREMMLKKIGSGVSMNYVRQEQNLVKYVIAFLQYNKQAPDNEIQYLNDLYQVGTQIDWNRLGGSGNSNIQSVTGSNLL